MKKSTTLTLLCVLIIAGCLIFYNFKLKAMYDSKSYRDPYNGMEFTPMSGVEKLNLKTSYNTNIKIEQGDKEGYWIDIRIKEKAKVSVSRDMLDIDLKGSKKQLYEGSIVIIAKNISDLVVSHNIFKSEDSYFNGQVNVKGYNLNKLNLQVSGTVLVKFEDVKVDTLSAVIGKKPGYAVLDLSYGTQLNVANYDIGVSGNLKLSGTNISTRNNEPSSIETTAQK